MEVDKGVKEQPGQSKNHQRNTTIDLIRLFAAFGVINIHVPSGTKNAETVNAFFSPLCVSFFFLTSLVYFVSSLSEKTTLKLMLNKAFKRIVIPYLAWTSVYVFFIFVKDLVTHKPHHYNLWRILFYGDTSVQIYFLPELFFLQFITLSVFFLFSTGRNKKMTGTVLFVITSAYFLWGHFTQTFGVLSTGMIIFFILSACFMGGIIRNQKNNLLFVLAGIFLVVLTLYVHSPYNSINYFYYLADLPTGGLGLLLIAVGLPRLHLSEFWLTVVSASFGIYLCHVIFLETFQFVTEHAMHKTIVYDVINKVAIAFIVFVLSLLFTFFLRALSVTRKLFLGE